MKTVDLLVESKIKITPRIQQLSGMFDAPIGAKLSHRWKGDVPIDDRDWNVGLIVGPSGVGKSSVMRQLFGPAIDLTWKAPSLIDDFDKKFGIQEITDACSAVGFNTVPSWAKPYAVLSTGEKFRADLARAILERPDPIVIDEFTSVVDRQVAQIGSYAVQKFVRARKRKFVAVTCHYDVQEWLQPDWILEPATMAFTWREVRRRPSIEVEIRRVQYEAWRLFAPYHYLTAELSTASSCYGLFINGAIAAFAGVLHRPHPKVDDIKGVSRLVTLPDYQGLGLAFVLVDALGAAYRATGYRLRTYPAHPALVRGFDRTPKWRLEKKPGKFSPAFSTSSSVGAFGGRPCAVFEYTGDTMGTKDARALIGKDAA
jgi:GNAT superfamily N-acetyltransferase